MLLTAILGLFLTESINFDKSSAVNNSNLGVVMVFSGTNRERTYLHTHMHRMLLKTRIRPGISFVG